MSAGQIALVIVGLVGLAESTWGITSPGKLKAAVRTVAADAPQRNVGLGVFFAALAGVLWFLISPDRRVSDYALLILSWIFAGGALVNFLTGGFQRLVAVLVLDRPVWFIRVFYGVEFLAASFLILVAVFGL